jgi:hypothetical protein
MLEEQKGTLEEVKGEDTIDTTSLPNFIEGIPSELLMEVFKWLDVRTFLCAAPFVCKEWNAIIHSEKWRKQTGKLFKQHCFAIWQEVGIYQATQKYLEKFGNWRAMIKQRPLIRFDGFYICKMMYRRTGLNINSLNNPVHEVVWYRYIRFRPDRTAVSLYTNATPKRFFPKYT